MITGSSLFLLLCWALLCVLTLNWEPAVFFCRSEVDPVDRNLKDQTGSLSFEIVNRNSS